MPALAPADRARRIGIFIIALDAIAYHACVAVSIAYGISAAFWLGVASYILCLFLITRNTEVRP